MQKHVAPTAQINTMDQLLDHLGSKEWIEWCRSRDRSQSEGLPAGVTYLSQLMAHDMFLTEARNAALVPPVGKSNSTTVNLQTTPLMLNTIYGRTGVSERLLYDERDPAKFDLFEVSMPDIGIKTVPKFVRDPRLSWSHPVLADARNFSTPILAQLAGEFMSYHNRMVDELRIKGCSKDLVFSCARVIVLRTWHNILLNEVLGLTCRDVKGKPFPGHFRAKGYWKSTFFLSNVALRSFHALVRPGYRFNGPSAKRNEMPISEILKRSSRGPKDIPITNMLGFLDKDQQYSLQVWLKKWGVQWEMFFDEYKRAEFQKTAENRTGFTPSFTFSRPPNFDPRTASKGAQPIHKMDSAKSKTAKTPSKSEPPDLRRGIDELFAAIASNGMHVANPQLRSQLPLPIALVAESYFDPQDGKLGWLGSAILQRQIPNMVEKAAARVNEFASLPDARKWAPASGALPKTFLEMTRN